MSELLREAVLLSVGIGTVLWIAAILEGLMIRRGWIGEEHLSRSRISILRYWRSLFSLFWRGWAQRQRQADPTKDGSTGKRGSPQDKSP